MLHALAADDRVVRTVELDILVGFGWIVTVHAEPLASIDHVYERLQRPNFAADDARHLGARLTEFVGERYLPILDDLDAQILDLEDEAVVRRSRRSSPDIHALRRDIAVLRRVLGPQRRVLEVLMRSEHGLDERAGPRPQRRARSPRPHGRVARQRPPDGGAPCSTPTGAPPPSG